MVNIHLFLGSERFIIQNKIQNIITNSHCGNLNINKYDCDEVNISVAIQDALTPPFLSDKKVVIIKNPVFLTKEQTIIKHDIEMFHKFLLSPSPTTIFIINAADFELDKSKEIVKVLLKIANVNETKELTFVEVEGWLKRQFSLNGYKITNEAVKEFLNRNGVNLLRAKNEVDKLINYCSDTKVVTIDDVKTVVIKESETEVFALTKAIISKDKEKIILIYQDLIKNGKDAFQLLGLISRSMCDLLLVGKMMEFGYGQKEIAKKLNISSGRVYYLMRDIKAFAISNLESLIERLASLDYRIKTGQIEATSGLELFLFSL